MLLALLIVAQVAAPSDGHPDLLGIAAVMGATTPVVLVVLNFFLKRRGASGEDEKDDLEARVRRLRGDRDELEARNKILQAERDRLESDLRLMAMHVGQLEQRLADARHHESEGAP